MKYLLPLLFYLLVPILDIYAQDNQLILEEQAIEAYDNKEYEKASRLYEQLTQYDWNYSWDAAKCFALIGDYIKSISFIKNIIENDSGPYTSYSYSQFMLDPDFINIRDIIEFKTLVNAKKKDDVIYFYDIVMDLVSSQDSIITYNGKTVELGFTYGEYLKRYGRYDSISDITYFDKSISFFNCKILNQSMSWNNIGLTFLSMGSLDLNEARFDNVDINELKYHNSNELMYGFYLTNSKVGSIELMNTKRIDYVSFEGNIIGKVSKDLPNTVQLANATDSHYNSYVSIGLEFWASNIERVHCINNKFIGTSKTDQISIQGKVSEVLFDKNEIQTTLNLNKLKVQDSFSFTENILDGYISHHSTVYAEFENQFRWNQIMGDKIIVIEDVSGYECLNCSFNFGQQPKELLNELSYERFVNSYYKLYQIYKSRGDLESANGCYAEMKDVMGRRLQSIYARDGGFQNYIQWKLNRLLKLYTNHGTNLALPIVISINVILAFSIFYFFFPSEWDVTSKSKLLHDFKEFKTKNDKGYFRPFLVLMAGLFVSLLNAFTLSVNAFVTLGFGSIPTKGLARYVCILQGFIGWFLLSIFTVTLINQVLF